MKKSFIFCATALFATIILCSCSSEQTKKQIQLENSVEKFIENLVNFSFASFKSRAAKAESLSAEEIAFFEKLEIEDENGNSVLFSQLSVQEQNDIVELWFTDYKADLLEKVYDDEFLLDYIEKVNKGNEIASSMNPATQKEYDELVLQYSGIIETENPRTNKKARSSSASDTKIRIEEHEMNYASKEKLKANYKPGRILIGTGTSSSGSLVGHSSMIYVNPWNENLDRNVSTFMSITSFPHDGHQKVIWDGQTDGVQFEPIGYWCGTAACKTVKLYDVKKKKFTTKKNVNSYILNSSEYQKALNFAYSKLGKPYPPYKGGVTKYDFITYANSDVYYYCSSLVRRSFLQVNIDVDPDGRSYVSPADIASSNYTYKVANWKNY